MSRVVTILQKHSLTFVEKKLFCIAFHHMIISFMHYHCLKKGFKRYWKREPISSPHCPFWGILFPVMFEFTVTLAILFRVICDIIVPFVIDVWSGLKIVLLPIVIFDFHHLPCVFTISTLRLFKVRYHCII